MYENLAKELLNTFDELEEAVNLYKKVERTYDMPMILDTNVRENINKLYKLTLNSIGEVLRENSIAYDKYDINEILNRGKEIGLLNEEIYKLLASNFIQFNDLNLHQQHSVNFLIDWYLENKNDVNKFKLYVEEIWLNKWFK